MAGAFDDLIPNTRAPGGLAPITIGTPRVDPSKAATTRHTEVQTAADAATLPYAGAKAAAEARRAAAEATKATIEANQSQQEANALPKDPKLALFIKDLGLNELLDSVRSARKEIGTGRAIGITGAMGRLFPGSSANDFKGSLDSIQGAVIMEKLQALKDASKTGASGMGALSEREGQRLAASIAALNTNLSDDKLKQSLATIERHALSLQAVGSGENPDDPAVAKKYGISVDDPNKAAAAANVGPANPNGGAPPNGTPPSNLTLSAGKTETFSDPALVGVNAKVASMIKRGSSAGEVRQYLETVQPGLGANAQNIDTWVKFAAQHPDKPVNVQLDQVTRPLTPAGSMMNAAAQSGPGAGVIGAADMLSGGTLDNMTGNPALTRAGMAGVAQAHPNWTLGGQIAGGVGSGLLAEGALARAGVGGLGAMLGGDAIPGIAYGAGSSDDGGRVGGAALGGLSGLVGGVAGRGLGKLVSGVGNEAVQRLAQQDVRMTPGRLFGGAAKGLEDKLASVPILGDIITPGLRQSRRDVNAAAFRQMSPDITDIGQQGLQQAKAVETKAYGDALGGVAVHNDTPFVQDFGEALQQGAQIPGLGKDFQSIMATKVAPIVNQGGGQITGDQFQDLTRVLRKTAKSYRLMDSSGTNPMGGEVANALGGVEDAFTGMIQRQAPEVMPGLQAANTMHAQREALKGAVLSAEGQGGEFSPLQLARSSIQGTRQFAGKEAAAVGNRPFNQLTQDAQEVLPAVIPDSGTAARLMIPGALGLVGGGGLGAYNDGAEGAAEGASSGLATGAALTAALASPYLARPLLQKLMTGQRPIAVQQLGELLGRSRLPGALGVTPLLAGSQ